MSIQLYECECHGKGFISEAAKKRHEAMAGKTMPNYMTDTEMREQATHAHVRANSTASKPKLHLPDGDDVVCLSSTRSGEWVKRDLEHVPPGWSEWCKLCQKEVHDADD